MLFAQLIVNKKKYGVHAFLVTIRDSYHKVLPGIKLGSIAIKKGMHGLDNGFIKFSMFRVPKAALLDRFSWINEKGEFESKLADPKISSIVMTFLTGGRIGWTRSFAEATLRATSIALRYGVMRKQFSLTPKGPEMSIIDYRGHQYRLIPRFCEGMVQLVGIANLYEVWVDQKIEENELVNEKHNNFLAK